MTADLMKLNPSEIHGWVPVLVPEADYLNVCEFVAARQAERTGGPTPSTQHGEPTASDPRLTATPAWPEEALRRLANSESITAQRWARAMDAIAQGNQD